MIGRHWLAGVLGTIATLAFLGGSSLNVAGGSKAGAGEGPMAGMGTLIGKVAAPKEFKAEAASNSEKSNQGEKSSKPPAQPPATVAKPVDQK